MKYNRMREEWLGITYPSFLLCYEPILNFWKKIFCPKGWHLFDECQSVEGHELYCDACGLEVHIAVENKNWKKHYEKQDEILSK